MNEKTCQTMKKMNKLQEASIGIAVRHFFCDIGGDELEVYEQLGDDTKDCEAYAWQPFEDYDKEQLFEAVDSLKDDIYHTFSQLIVEIGQDNENM